MTDREKLIAILRETEIDNVDGQTIRARMSFVPSVFEKLADHLISHGVTVQLWIPVTERLPPPFVSVLVYMPDEAPLLTVHEGFWVDSGKWYAAHFDREKDEVTHWMPLPEAPKEGEA